MRVYPVNMLLDEKKCLVVGGGEVAARKVEGLLDAGAIVTVVSPAICEAIETLVGKKCVKWLKSEWRGDLLNGAAAMIVATDDVAVNRRAAADARAAKVPVNVADMPDECDFILPSVFRRGPITIAAGTGGLSPALSAHLRRKLQDTIGEEYASAAETLGKLRKMLDTAAISPDKRRAIFKELVSLGLAEKIKEKDQPAVESFIREVIGRYVENVDFPGDKT